MLCCFGTDTNRGLVNKVVHKRIFRITLANTLELQLA